MIRSLFRGPRTAGFLAILLFLWTASDSAFAGGPGALIASGQYARWDPARPVSFVIDPGPLRAAGPMLTSQQGAELVRNLVGVWENVGTASVRFEDRGFLPQDVTATNISAFISGPRAEGNPIIFDADGSITEQLLGEGSSENVLGFASSDIVDESDDFFDFGFAVLNGKRASTSPTSSFSKTIVHEVGHLLGLDHSQAGNELFRLGVTSSFRFIPVMFPFVVSVPEPAQLLRDDVAWISYLYPEPDFRSTTGTLRGVVRRRAGGIFQGANVVAVEVTRTEAGDLKENTEEMVSVVSDFLSTDDGVFEIPGLTPGDYVVFIEALDSRFVAGSGVGPFDIRFTNFPKDYYNEDNESGTETDDPSERAIIHMEPGSDIQLRAFVSNESANQLGSLEDDDQELFVFPDGFNFPFFGTMYQQVTVNSDGNLTFGDGDSSSDVRGQTRFLQGPPRIAPLFTDLNPEAGGLIRAEADEASVTFIWEGVPEFSLDSQPEGNTFSTTLFANGNILFHYEKVVVTPDGPQADPSRTQAVVGITPGAPASAASSNLRDQISPIPLEQAPIFQTFHGNEFNLTGANILFQAEGSQFFLLFPFYRGNDREFTGFAVSNDSAGTARLEVETRTPAGQLAGFPSNPSQLSLESKHQLARLGSDFFGIDFRQEQNGWVRIGSNTQQLASFFQFGDGLTGTISKLDGSVALTSPSQVLYFTRLYDGLSSFPTLSGPRDAQTFMHVANPSRQQVTLSFRLFNVMGQTLGDPVQRVLPALGSLREQLSSLFPQQGPVANGFVRVDVTGPGAVGFELIELSDTVLGFNATTGNTASTSYSAQLAHGNAGGTSIFTSLKLTNVSSQQRAVILRALRENGTELSSFGPILLNPNQSFQRDVGEIFGLGPPTGPSTAGSLRVEADGAGVVGDIVFGDPDTLRYAAALPLQSTLIQKGIFSQVANAIDMNPRLSTFTGLAFHNPGSLPADITIRVFRETSELTGERTIRLGAGERLSDLLALLVPESAGQVRGYIEVESTQPIVAQQLFGNLTLDFLSAVPSSAVESNGAGMQQP